MVQQLLAAAADCDIPTHDGMSPLHAAVSKGHLEVAGAVVRTWNFSFWLVP